MPLAGGPDVVLKAVPFGSDEIFVPFGELRSFG